MRARPGLLSSPDAARHPGSCVSRPGAPAPTPRRARAVPEVQCSWQASQLFLRGGGERLCGIATAVDLKDEDRRAFDHLQLFVVRAVPASKISKTGHSFFL